jgi:hypothetical protein
MPTKALENAYAAIMQRMQSDPTFAAAFASDPVSHLKAAGIPLLPTVAVSPTVQGAIGSSGMASSFIMATTKAGMLAALGAATSAVAGTGAALPLGTVKVETHWWGVDIIMDEAMSVAVTHALDSDPNDSAPYQPSLKALTSEMTTMFVNSPVVPNVLASVFALAFYTIFTIKWPEVKLMDAGGNGVHWPISWIQWAGLASGATGGPTLVIAAGMAFMHPLPN